MPTIYKQNKTLGFTLIELLVVISIIGLLGTLAVTALNNARVNTRNARRNGDIVQLIKAFQQIADDNNGEFPLFNGGIPFESSCVSKSCYGCFVWYGMIRSVAIDNTLASYIKTPSVDPPGGRGDACGTGPTGGYAYRSFDGKTAYLKWPLELVTITDNVCGPGYVKNVGSYILCEVAIK